MASSYNWSFGIAFEVPINLDAGPLIYLIVIFQVIFINLQWKCVLE